MERNSKRKCRQQESCFTFIAFSWKQVSAHPHQGCAWTGCVRYSYILQSGPTGLHSPSSMAFISNQFCFQVTIMGLNLIVFQALVDPWCGINVHTASLILSTVLGEKWKAISHPFLQWRKERQSKLLTVHLCPAFWTFPSGYPAGLSNSTHPKLNSFSSIFQNTSLFLGIVSWLLALLSTQFPWWKPLSHL